MKNWGRRIRAAIVMGLTWAAAYATAGFLLARVPGFESDVPFAILFAPLGLATGIIFSGILVAIEGRRSFDRMSVPRFTGWGAMSGLLLFGISAGGLALRGETLGREVLVFGLVLSTASAACAAGTLALARRAEGRELPRPAGDSSDAGLTEEEKRELLGRGH